MALQIYNTLTRKEEAFETLTPGLVKMYVCGPTVYSNSHVGHAMSSLVFDIIRRYLEYRGYNVEHAMNFTDVDDKIIQRAQQEGIDPFALGERYITQYKKHLEDLNILPATFNPRATQEIPQIIAMIQELIERGFAYPLEGDVYFRVRRDPDYGKLSHRKLDELESGTRLEVDTRKEDPFDFALWKTAKPGEPSWDSPWGKGRPGWHIECSAMNLHHLGEQIDLHGGGNDLIFPHHENEIAQTETLTGKPFARYWVHNGMVQLSGEKMSKSTGKLVTIEDFLNQHSGDTLRMMVLNSGYRGPLTFNDEVIGQAEKALDRLRSALRPVGPNPAPASQAALESLHQHMQATRTGFEEAMDNDFNTAGALGNLFELVRSINQARDSGLPQSELQPAQDLLRDLAGVLGLRLEEPTAQESQAGPFIDLLIEVRRELRNQKLWALSDQIRDQLTQLGVTLEDSKEGTTWRWS